MARTIVEAGASVNRPRPAAIAMNRLLGAE
jgi:hypothetical protein